MTRSTTLRARAAALAATAGLALAGAVVLSTPAQAALTETNYGFQATAYGTRVQAPQAQVGLPRTAFSYIFCTRLAGKTSTNSLEEELGLPLNEANPLVKINAVKTTTRSFKDLQNNIAGASQGRTSIGSIVLGGVDGGPELSFDGLRTVSTAWADRDGKLHAKNDISALDLDLTLPTPPETGTPLDDLFDAITNPVGDVLDQVIDVLQDNLGSIEIPGLGTISLASFDRRGVGRTTAYASSFLFRLDLYGLDGDPDTLEDNIELGIGRSWARITKGVRSGVMSGVGLGSRVSTGTVLGDVGDLAWKQLPCEGTRGDVLTRSVSAANLGLSVPTVLTSLRGSSYGEQLRRGKAYAWTRGTAGKFTVNGDDLVIEGVVGRTNVRQSAAGGIDTDFVGSRIGRILVNGKVLGRDITPRTASSVKLPEIPGVVSIRLFPRDKWRRGGNITAVKVVLAEAVSPVTVSLGFARTAIKRY
jgi:hypothetical protein